MFICDVNVLIAAFRKDDPRHPLAIQFVERLVHGKEPYGWSTSIFASVIRITTNAKVWQTPNSPEQALAFCNLVKARQQAQQIEPGPAHWGRLESTLRSGPFSANDVMDVVLAALAMEFGCTLVTWDQGFKRFKGLSTVTVEQALGQL